MTSDQHQAARRELKSQGLLWPLESGESRRRSKWKPAHEGLDLEAGAGTPVYVSGDGVVLYSGRGIESYGNLIVVKHSDRLATVYAHNRRNLVVRGQKVKQGQKIALVGSSGAVKTPRLHFEVRDGNRPVDPKEWVSARSAASVSPQNSPVRDKSQQRTQPGKKRRSSAAVLVMSR